FRSPLRAPTIRSVPEIVLAKLARASVRTRSTPSSSATLTAIENAVSSAVTRRFQMLFSARRRIVPLAMGAAPAGTVQFRQRQAAVELGGQRAVVADEDNGAAGGAALGHQQGEEVLA